MKELTFRELMIGDTESLSQEITAKYAEGVEEPLTGYQKDIILQYKMDESGNHWSPRQVGILAKSINVQPDQLTTPPSPNHPGVGVVMVNIGAVPYVILDWKEKKCHVFYRDHGIIRYKPSDIKDDRPATAEEITSFWHPEN